MGTDDVGDAVERSHNIVQNGSVRGDQLADRSVIPEGVLKKADGFLGESVAKI